MGSKNILDRAFSSCSDDPKGSVHRAWGISLICVIVFFVISIFEMTNLQAKNASKALMFASIWTGIMHLALGILGTFVLKRFPTQFSVGFFLGVVVVLANQNLILFGTFHGYMFGNPSLNHAFANLGLTLFFIMAFFSVLLYHFKASIVVAPVDIKSGRIPTSPNSAGIRTSDSADEYQQYNDESTGP